MVARAPFGERVAPLVERAIADGARVLLGGEPNTELGGLYFAPTILTDVAQDSEIVQEEVFGPVLTVQTFTSEEQAIEMANDTRFGLAATLVTGDPERAERVSAAFERRHSLGQLLLRPRSGRPVRRQRPIRHRPRRRDLVV